MSEVLALVDPCESEIHVASRLNDGAGQAHILASCDDMWALYVVEVVGSHAVMLHDEAGRALGQEIADPLRLVLGVAESRELENPPSLSPVALGMPTAQERRRSGQRAACLRTGCRYVVGAVRRLQRYP